MKLDQVLLTKDNNFNLLRFIAALLVLYSHSYAIYFGGGEFEPLRDYGLTWGKIAVDLFFVTSGLLITQSFERSNLFSFISKRVMRIYPGLIVSILITLIVISPDFSNYSTYKYILKNCTLFFGVEHTLPGVFEQNSYPRAINGSLWTLPWEVRCYALLVVLLMFRQKYVQTTAFVLSTILYFVFEYEYLRLIFMFLAGSTLYSWKEYIKFKYHHFIIIVGSYLILLYFDQNIIMLYSITLPYLTLFLAFIPGGQIRKFNRIGDYSYGIYIYAWPIQQLLSQKVQNVGTHIVLSSLITLLMAFLSWHLIEKRFIGKDISKLFFQFSKAKN